MGNLPTCSFGFSRQFEYALLFSDLPFEQGNMRGELKIRQYRPTIYHIVPDCRRQPVDIQYFSNTIVMAVTMRLGLSISVLGYGCVSTPAILCA